MKETNTSDKQLNEEHGDNDGSLYYAISNDKNVEKGRLNTAVVYSKDENNRAHIAPSFNDYPSLDSVNTNQERETIAKAAFEAEGLRENRDFKFISMEEMHKIVEKHNDTLKNDHYGQIDFLGNNGVIGKTIYYKDKQSFNKEVSESNDVGRPISYQVYNSQHGFMDSVKPLTMAERMAAAKEDAKERSATQKQNGDPEKDKRQNKKIV